MTLRKEQGISQKQASENLGISQALLSHYEKGIRECGLDFIVKCADYYNVTCDYLLGKSAVRHSSDKLDDITPAPENKNQKNMIETLNKKVAVNSIDFIYRLLSEINNKQITKYSTEIIMSAIYSVIRSLYNINPHNDENFFALTKNSHQNYVNSSININTAKLIEKTEEVSKSRKNSSKPELSYEIIIQKYGDIASSVLNLLHNTEKELKK